MSRASDGLSEIALEESAVAKRIAYADPPYPGQAARWYRDHPDFDGEVNLDVLLATLQEYDGWALSTSMISLRYVLLRCPATVVTAVWHVTNAMPPGGAKGWLHHYAWEPVIVRPARPNPKVKNVMAAPSPMGFLSTRNGEETFPGKKPPAFSRWLFELLGARGHDDFTDLFPGSGAVGREWQAWSSQTRLAV